jgi:hypothetical protein
LEVRPDRRWCLQNVDVVRCQQGHQMELLLLFRLFKQRYDTWEVSSQLSCGMSYRQVIDHGMTTPAVLTDCTNADGAGGSWGADAAI